MDNDNQYYWAGDLILEQGSILMPGNWYRIVSTTPGHNLALREEIYEGIRSTEFSHLPSRKKSLFLCRTESEMKNFMLANQRTNALVYKVELIEPAASSCVVDSGLCAIQNMQEGGRLLSIVELEEQSRKYWNSASGEFSGIAEVVTESGIKIMKRMSG